MAPATKTLKLFNTVVRFVKFFMNSAHPQVNYKSRVVLDIAANSNLEANAITTRIKYMTPENA
jgi:hypothetical protein